MYSLGAKIFVEVYLDAESLGSALNASMAVTCQAILTCFVLCESAFSGQDTSLPLSFLGFNPHAAEILYLVTFIIAS